MLETHCSRHRRCILC